MNVVRRDVLTEPLTLHEVLLLAARETYEYLVCVVCGGTPTEHGVVLTGDRAELLAGAWCSAPDCQADRAAVTALTVPVHSPLPSVDEQTAAADERARLAWWLRADASGPAGVNQPEFREFARELADVLEQHPERWADAPTGRTA